MNFDRLSGEGEKTASDTFSTEKVPNHEERILLD